MLHIVFDVDDVLNNLMYSWLQNFNKSKKTNIKYKELIYNPPYEIIGIDKLIYLNSLDYFRYYYYEDLTPNQKILDWFKENEHKAYFSVLTSTPGAYASIVSNWVFKYFSQWIRTFAFIPSDREGIKLPMYDKLKADWLYRNHADIFIDDSYINCLDAVYLGVQSFCLKQPWNGGDNIDIILEKLNREI
jgi:hypothetical protein